MKLLEGKSAIVTGSGRGIGRAVATLFAEHGAHVVVNDLDGDVAEGVVNSINGSGGVATPTRRRRGCGSGSMAATARPASAR